VISPSYKIEEFLKAVEDRDYLDIIYLADREATETERHLYHPRASARAKAKGGEEYAKAIESLISYLRYGYKPHGISEANFELFRSICDSLSSKRLSTMPCHRYS
jgi:hypothetical protein